MQTACSDTFRLKLSQGEHLLVVADEVHEMGSSERSKLFSIEAEARLGLSATPRRFGDPEGTYKVFNYFGKVLQPPFTLVDAIQSGRLVKYEYFPHTVRLTASETDAWAEATEKIKREIARLSHGENGQATISDAIKMMLIQRSRIAKKAAAKIGLASEVLSKNYEEGQRWLVYCEDQDQLSQVVDVLKNVGLTVNQYHTAMSGDPEASLEWFRKLGGILVSIRCLDQGVDIPEISHALILASSQNPRQFIQRRGRVLRTAPGKFGATIHDAIVIPPSIYDEPEQMALARAELQRAIEFSDSAVNRFADAELRSIAAEIGLDIAVSSQVGYEEDETEEQNG
jgi:superfamily II DNA or RNA helicase